MSNQKFLFRGLDLVSDSVFVCVTPALHVPVSDTGGKIVDLLFAAVKTRCFNV